MTCRVITIARSLGAGGEEIARSVAGELGFRYLDEEIVRRAAEKAGVSSETVAQAEHTPGLVIRILDTRGRLPVVPLVGPVVPAAYDPPLGLSAYENLIVEVIRETAAQGKVVIVAHGAGIHLAGLSGQVDAGAMSNDHYLPLSGGLPDDLHDQVLVGGQAERWVVGGRHDGPHEGYHRQASHSVQDANDQARRVLRLGHGLGRHPRLFGGPPDDLLV